MPVEPTSSALRTLTLTDIQRIFRMTSKDQARVFCQLLSVPLLRYVDATGQPSEQVLAASFEAALFAQMLPGGSGIEIPHVDLPAVDTLPEAAYQISGAFRVLDYWDLFRENPYMLHLLMAVCHLIYGEASQKDLKKRLWALGDMLLNDTNRVRQQRGTP